MHPTLDYYLELALSKCLRPFLREVVSSKRISQSGMKKLATVESPPSVRYVTSTKDTNLDTISNEASAYEVLVVGGSDRDFFGLPAHGNHEIKFFVQNLCVTASPSVLPLPIGIEDISRARAGMPWNSSGLLARREKNRFLLVGPFGNTHPERVSLTVLADNPGVVFLQRRLSSFRYALIASKFAFIACPRGNGRDTHRIWESLYRGSVPVLLEDEFSSNLRAMGLPVVLTPSWHLAPEMCQKNRNLTGFNPEDLHVLRPSHWAKKFRSLSQ